MDDSTLRVVIREKLRTGLPNKSAPRFWSGPADREVCDACDKPITKQQLVMEGIASALGRAKEKKPIQLPVHCFEIWNDEWRKPREMTA